MRVTFTLLALLAALSLAVSGCNSGKRSNSVGGNTSGSAGGTGGTTPVSSGGGTTPPPPPPPPSPSITVAVGTAVTTPQKPDAGVRAFAFTLAAGAAAPMTVTTIAVKASGTIPDNTSWGTAQLIDDTNSNGLVEAGEAILATVAAPAFAADDGTLTFTPGTAITINAGATRQFIVLLATAATPNSALDLSNVGKTVSLGITAASSIAANTSGTSIPATGTFPVNGGSVTWAVGDHLLVSEIVTGPGTTLATSAEFVELFNPTGGTLDLSTTYVTDFTSGSNSPGYFLVTTGTNFGNVAAGATGTGADDFLVKFPPGTMLGPGKVIVVALSGAGFATAYGSDPDFYMSNPSATGTQMHTWNGMAAGAGFAFSAAAIGNSVTLANSGEVIFVYRWDGTSDLVSDLDMVVFPDTTAPTNFQVDKSGLTADSAFDADAAISTYLTETSVLAQDARRAAQPSNTEGLKRVDYREGTESKTASNGVGGHDETSENWNVTFMKGAKTAKAVP